MSSWEIDCSRCCQYWRTSCATLIRIGQKNVNWLCPFCYTAPVSTLEFANETSWFTCRNTKTLKDANYEFEVSIAAIDMKTAYKPTHAESSEKSIRCIKTEMKQLDEACQTDTRKLIREISQLRNEMCNFFYSTDSVHVLPAPSASAISNHDAFLKSKYDRLDSIIAINQASDTLH